MGQKIYKTTYTLRETLTKEEMKYYLENGGFVFSPNNYYYPCSTYYDGLLYSLLNASTHKVYKSWRTYKNFDELLDALLACTEEEKKWDREQKRKKFIVNLENLANLGFAPDIDYRDFSYHETEERLRLAKEKRREYIESIIMLGKNGTISTQEEGSKN